MYNDLKKQNVRDYKIAYHRGGAGQTVLLVHGITTYSFIWRELFSLLMNRYDIISIDLLGSGESDKPLDEDYSIVNQAEIIKEFMDGLGIAKFHFVGHDVGGGIGQVFAVKYPQKLIDLALINSVAYDFWPVQPIVAMKTPIIRQLAMATLDLGTFKLIIRRALYHKEKLTDELMEFFWKNMSGKQNRKAFLRFAKSLDSRQLLDIEEELHRMTIPLLIIRGDEDIYLSASISNKLHKNIPGSQLINISTGGHFSQIDEPEIIAKALNKFFSEPEI